MQWRALEGEVIALEARSAIYLATNGTGALLWNLIAEGTTRGRLVAELVGEFEIEAARAEHDVDAFLGDLAKHDLLEKPS